MYDNGGMFHQINFMVSHTNHRTVFYLAVVENLIKNALLMITIVITSLVETFFIMYSSYKINPLSRKSPPCLH